jgi:hypothetical protein
VHDLPGSVSTTLAPGKRLAAAVLANGMGIEMLPIRNESSSLSGSLRRSITDVLPTALVDPDRLTWVRLHLRSLRY